MTNSTPDAARRAQTGGERRSRSGVPLKDFYGAGDARSADEAPGAFAFTRGRRASPAAVGGWIQRGLSGEGDPARSNEQFRYLISQGQTGLNFIVDAPTQALIDPDHPLAGNAVGTQGVSLCHKQDFLQLLKDLPLDRITVSTSMTNGLFALTAVYLAARELGFAVDKLRGSVLQLPFYGEDVTYAVHVPFEGRVRMSCDVMEFCAREMPRFHSFVEDTYFFSESGLNAVEEMALGFVEIRYLVRQMLKRGVPIDAFAPRIAIVVNCGMDFFEEVAKLRATRRLFAKMMRDEFGATDPRSWSVAIASHTSGLSLTAQQPANNIVRGTLQALSLVLGGASAIEISGFDEAFRTPSEAAHRLGLRTQQIIELETGITSVVDPLGGSYYVEALTAAMEERITAMIADIEGRGPPGELIESGWFRNFFEGTIARYWSEVESGQRQVVGVNAHTVPPAEDLLLRDVAETKIRPYRERIEQVREFKRRRDVGRVRAALAHVDATARGSGNLVQPVVDALDAGATIGEISGTIRQAYGAPYDAHGMVSPP